MQSDSQKLKKRAEALRTLNTSFKQIANTIDETVSVIDSMRRENAFLRKRNAALEARVAELERRIGGSAGSASAPDGEVRDARPDAAASADESAEQR